MNHVRPILPFALFGFAVIAAELIMRVSGTEFCLTQLTMAIYYALVALGLCLVMGYAGQVSLGHGAFFALGGYTSAVLTTHEFSCLKEAAAASWLKRAHVLLARQDSYGNPLLTVSPWAAFLAAMLLTLVVASLIGYPALRLRGHYLAMATLGFGLIVSKLLLASSVTGAADGINGVPGWELAAGLTISGKGPLRVENYYVACALTLLVLLVLRNLVHSRVGRALQAIHDGETAAKAMGINTARYKLKVFVLSALLAALAGVCFTHYTGGIGPSEAGALKSVRYVALAAAGGLANIWGVAVMSTALNYASLRGWFGSYDNAVFGGILILIVSLAPEGPLKPLGAGLRRLARVRRTPFRRHHFGGLSSEAAGRADDAPHAEGWVTNSRSAPAHASTNRAGDPARALLSVQNLSRSFGGLIALQGVSFEVSAGQIKAIIGPNGAGKTTLFNLISGLLKADSGEISFRGRSLRGMEPYQIARSGLSRTFQNPSLFPHLNVLENVMVGRHGRTRWELCGCAARWPSQLREEQAIRAAARAQLACVGLAGLAALPAGALAFGQRRMAELARALATEPALLLLDEPASGLNTKEKDELGELIRQIRDRGITVLLVEHDMSVVMGLSDEILVLHNGTVIAEGTPATVQNDARVIDVYLGGESEHVAPG